MKISKGIAYKLNQYFLTNLGMYHYRKGWLKGDCPSCGAKDKYGVNLSQNRTNCFSCTYNGKPIEAIAMRENLQGTSEVLKFIKGFEGIEYVDPPQELLHQKTAKMPEFYRPILLGRSQVSKCARNTLEKRGFNITELAMKGVGYCTSGPYEGRIILPFYEGGTLVYFNARAIFEGDIKFKNPSAEEFGVGKSLLIYNIDALAIYPKVYLVESVTNALTMGDRGIAIGGKVLSNYQLSKLLNSPIEGVVIGLDDDAWDYAIGIALQLVMYKKVKLLKMPYKKDINDLGKKKIKKMEKKLKWLSYGDILKIRNDG